MEAITCEELYLGWLKAEKGLSDNSTISYYYDLQRFDSFLRDYGRTDKEAEASHIREFIGLLDEIGFSQASIIRNLSTLRSYYSFLFGEALIQTDPTEHIRGPRNESSLPTVLSVDDIEDILAAIPTEKKLGLRNRAMIETLYGCGLRVSELINLSFDSLIEDNTFLLLRGKGKKERLVPLGPLTYKCLTDYIERERPLLDSKNAGEIFLNMRGTKLTRMGVWKMIRTVCETAGISDHVSPHTFRHSYATHLLEGGADLRIVQELLGHSNITTTEIYTHIDRTHLIEVHRNFHPRSNR
ncbi:MAG: site-specific tyrosine recombinase XerD [Fibrobacterota bacterium]